jgi:hypothetical protein
VCCVAVCVNHYAKWCVVNELVKGKYVDQVVSSLDEVVNNVVWTDFCFRLVCTGVGCSSICIVIGEEQVQKVLAVASGYGETSRLFKGPSGWRDRVQFTWTPGVWKSKQMCVALVLA